MYFYLVLLYDHATRNAILLQTGFVCVRLIFHLHLILISGILGISPNKQYLTLVVLERGFLLQSLHKDVF